MQTISEELKASLAKKNPTYKKVVELHRRLWSGGVYIYDTEIDVTNQVEQYGTIQWKFDNENFNTWTLDNTSLVFRNDRNQWKQGNEKGYFTGNYQIADSKIIIKFGAQLADGTFEVLKSFTGYIATDPIADPSNKYVTVTIQGGISIFEKKNAEEISTLVDDEFLGENTGTEFTTTNNGVGIIVIVKRGPTLGTAIEIKPTTDYTASDLNKKNLPLKITLVTALTAGEKLYISYRYWYQDKLLEWLVEQVMILCGVASYSISPAVFASNVENTWSFNSQADWNTCTLSNIDTITTPGSFKDGLIDDFGDGDYSANPAWTVGAGTWEIVNTGFLNILKPTKAGGISLPATDAKGTWVFQTFGGFSGGGAVEFFCFVSSTDNFFTTSGYCIAFRVAPGTGYQEIVLFRNDGTGTPAILGNYITGSTFPLGHIFRVDRDNAGLMHVYVDGVLRITATDNTYTTSNYILIAGYIADDQDPVVSFSNISFWKDGTTAGIGVLTSPVEDMGGVVSIGKLTIIYTGNPAQVLIETYTSGTIDFSADNDPAGWVAINSSGQILSAVKQYLKYRITLDLIDIDSPGSPVIDEISIKYYTTTTTIDLVNLTGMNCKEVLEYLAEMPAYEIGFKANETFVYRPRYTTVPSILDLKSDSNIKNLKNITDGRDKVYNRIVAEIGIYRVVSDASADSQPNSIDKYGTRDYSVSISNLLPAENVNLAYAVAPTILAYTKTPRKRCTVEAMFLPHLELGDKVTLYFNEPTALYRWLYGDTDMPYGRADLEYYDEDILKNRYNFWGTVARVEGLEFDPNTFQTKINLVEVL